MRKQMRFLKVGILALGVLAIGSCNNDDDSLPQIDGYNNSDEVGATYLVAHWTFDDTNNEVISSTAPNKTLGGVAFTTGQIGKALQLSKGAIAFPPIDKINTVDALNNFTVSLWVNVQGTKGVAGGGFTSFFGIFPTSVSDVWGNLQACAETSRHLPASDTLELKNYLNTTLADNSQSGQDNVALKNTGTDAPNGGTGKYFMGGNKWAHYVMTWDGATHQFALYGNGESVGGYTDRGTTPVLKMRVPAQAMFGSMASADMGFANATRPDWAPLATASIDDVRVFNTVLAQKDIVALFNLGTAGR
ncbi:LamG-like jellyroll fold domain-containing protein [Chryseolinea soli]|nr:LamG-like jellyroll fold domain-containing protein [Chryseolinea soli]